MLGIIWLFKWIIAGAIAVFSSIKGFLPQSFLGFFILIKFFINLWNEGFAFAFNELGKAIFSAEYVIYQNVNLAIEKSPEYTIFSLMEIFVSLMVLFYLVRMIAFLIKFATGGGAMLGVYLISILIVIIIQASYVRAVLDDKLFIPFYDGIFFMLINIDKLFFVL